MKMRCAVVLLSAVAAAALGQELKAQTTQTAPAADQDIGSPVVENTPAPLSLTAPTSSDQSSDGSSDIIVTGTHIVRKNLTSTSPITTIDSNYLRDRGLGRVTDALSVLPQVTPMLGLTGSTETSGPARIGLRNLGTGRTLTLLNGQRMDNDVNIIPGALVDRVDIMTGGASAVYGSDAIAGVVNFILKRKFTGFSADGEVSAQDHDNDNAQMLGILSQAGYPKPKVHYFGGEQYYASLAFGRNLFDDRLNLSAFVSFRRTMPIMRKDLDTHGCQLWMDPQRDVPENYVATHDQWDCAFTEYNPYGYFGTVDNSYENAPDGSRAWREFNANDVQRQPQADYVQRSDRTFNTGGFLSLDVVNDIKLNANFLYTRYRTNGQKTIPDTFYVGDGVEVPCDNPFLGAQQAGILCGANAGVAGQTGLLYPTLYRNGFNEHFQDTTKDWRGFIGATGTIVGKIKFEIGYQKSRHTDDYFSNNVYFPDVADRLARGLQVVDRDGVPTCLSVIDGTHPDCVPFDIFSSATQPSAAAFATLTTPGTSHQIYGQDDATAVISGTLGDYGLKSPLASEAIGFAIVGEHRRNTVKSGGEGGYSWYTSFSGDTSVNEVGGELDVPLIQDKPFFNSLVVNGGYRFSKYDVYSNPIHTWKAEVTWEPLAGLGFRASYNRAVRVGTQERLEAQQRYPNSYFLDLCAPPAAGANVQRFTFEQCAVGGMTRQQYDALTSYKGCDINGYCPTVLINGGNPDLKPERSRSYTIGMVLQPRSIRGLNLTVDYYNIDVAGSFEWARTGLAFNQCYLYGTPSFCAMYQRNPTTGVLESIDGRYSNSGFRSTQGIDVNGNYHLSLPNGIFGHRIGDFDFSFNGSYVLASRRQFAPNNPTWDCTGYFGFVCGDVTPRWRHYANVTWLTPWRRAAITVAWRHTAGSRNSKLSSNPLLASVPTAYDTDSYPLANRLPDGNYFDLAFNMPVTRQLRLRINAQNVFDKDPPKVGWPIYESYLNTFPSYYDALGRTLRVGLSLDI